MHLLLYTGERATDTHWTGGRVGSRASLDVTVRRKNSLHVPNGNQTCHPAHSPVTILTELHKLVPLLIPDMKFKSTSEADYPDCSFHGFPQSLQANSKKVHLYSPQPLPTSFSIQHSPLSFHNLSS